MMEWSKLKWELEDDADTTHTKTYKISIISNLNIEKL
jgi:hypothetical protein